jgi:hypothetical protein
MNKLGHFFNLPIVFPEWQDTSARRATGGIDQNDFNEVISGDAPASPKKNGGSTMGKGLHGCAPTAPEVRSAIQASKEKIARSVKTLWGKPQNTQEVEKV